MAYTTNCWQQSAPPAGGGSGGGGVQRNAPHGHIIGRVVPKIQWEFASLGASGLSEGPESCAMRPLQDSSKKPQNSKLKTGTCAGLGYKTCTCRRNTPPGGHKRWREGRVRPAGDPHRGGPGSGGPGNRDSSLGRFRGLHQTQKAPVPAFHALLTPCSLRQSPVVQSI